MPGMAVAETNLPTQAPAPVWMEMRQAVALASANGPPWDGPVSGPAGREGMTVAVVCEDLRNGGVLNVAKGVSEASKVLGWKISIYDAGGTPEGRDKAFSAAADSGADGLIIVGADAGENRVHLKQFSARRMPVVGWHVGPLAGPIPDSPVAMNVSTDPLEVARTTAAAAVLESAGRAGVVIFTDSNFAIAKAKANAMVEVIRACKGCTLLEVRDIAISRNAELMSAVTKQLLARYGKRWTHALAINDIYFDYAAQELTKAGRASDSISMLSAGDGSSSAFLRIKAGTFQTGTVAEPLNLHGWQLVDELNRLLSGQPVSGYVAPAHLVTAKNIAFDGGSQLMYDPDNGYREIYRRIWRR
ncbi:MAG: substrate-binding domain-containing protein [Gammaproteobacteria bacterium]|nr:substrate-binding domain-containing protein [Gammaproteobacteria bacterium]MBU1775865.1 substrate-binding domain-containing protein [Gammaproteobacteria bacterium]MBU1970020.1 substrate-binding domain-containing protein [Gammaproteobacteria bacterium]